MPDNPLLRGFAFSSRSLPVSTLGLGKGKASDKSYTLLRSMRLETGDRLPQYRAEVKSWLSDQSVEKEYGDAPATMIPPEWKQCGKSQKQLADGLQLLGGFGHSYLFPCCLTVHDHMHVFFNPLEKVITQSALWGRIE